ncbi:MAG: pitrilysin family protein [Planctomycetota bacterium]|nr:pitrilysin family protein [Planctomycetota bacterium]
MTTVAKTAAGSRPILVRKLPCGATVAIEENNSLRSCAIEFLFPGGAGRDPVGAQGEGVSALLSELVQRGAGKRSSREFADALEMIGASASAGSHSDATDLGGSCLSEHAADLLELQFDMVRRPWIADAEVEPARSLALQAIRSIQDSPPSIGGYALRTRVMPPPLNRTGLGHPDGLARWDGSSLREWWAKHVGGQGASITVAGGVDAGAILDTLSRLTDGWTGQSEHAPLGTIPRCGRQHITYPAAQTIMLLGRPSATTSDPNLLAMKVIVHIIGGSSSSRLFTEVRERRGLCYGIGMSQRAGLRAGMTVVEAASTPARAPETLARIREELGRVGGGVTREEFTVAMTGFKTALVFAGESAGSRVGSMMSDLIRGIEPRSLAMIAAEVDALTLDGINEVAARRFGEEWLNEFSVTTVGPEDPFATGELGWSVPILESP